MKKVERLSFNLYEFRFFNSSEHGSAMPLGNSKFLVLLMAVPYILSCEVMFFRRKRFFLKLGNYVAGVFVLNEKPSGLRISSLAVAPELRRFGIASCILSYADRMAKILGKEYLELSVFKKNLPARRLYRKFGFSQKEERKETFILAKKV